MKSLLSILLFIMFLLTTPLWGQDSEATAEDDTEQGVSIYETWEESLKYGIDATVITTIDEMIERKDDHFSDVVLTLLSSRRESLRIKALDFFEALELDTAIDTVLDELEFYQDLDRGFLIRLIQHLQRREHQIDRGLWQLLREIIEEEDRDVRSAAVRFLGEREYAPAAEFLAELYEDSDTDQPVRETILRALGRIKDPSSEDLIFDLAGDENIDKTQRIAAIEAAGNYGNRRAMNVIGEAFSSGDPLIRSAAVGSLTNFPINQVKELYLEALRDSFWRIRLNALRGISENPFEEAFEPLRFMARQDPENNIKIQALRSLAALNKEDAWQFLRESMENSDIGLPFRQTIALELIEGDFEASRQAIERVMVEEWEEENSRLLDTICKELSIRELPSAEQLYLRMLNHENYIIQIYGVRGIGRNGLTAYRTDLETIIENEDSHPALKSNAQTSMEQL